MILLNISSFTIEEIKDPTGILTGKRYEYFLDIDVDEEDELYSDQGIRLRVLYYKGTEDEKILNYYFQENNTDKIFDFALDEEEEIVVTKFCKEHLDEDNE
ncbi:DUF6509 family protein [Cytobacillus horneckiae]|uniref:DUF6509 family protein n=1 Tax=Cytobacillus horneckiae TaxID=549687 RepID=UPI0008248924|nr:DUF6509 family protein [Cytobacillus horneckiae]NRG47705.1 pullulanase [Bacillus sp. CRN 9]MBN6885716.1 pullulanase [Cytobacillus horneckiae]MCM3177265.1 DUF6509 family protein [Cytobacillus horneckiae]MEC1156174.1 DUF6509 family protein [Cytobacillus horneckiae]MED2938192.1 DUF6509 family protein [Cytobacillus horneckiae]